MNFRLARDQVVLLETAVNSWASRRKANDFFAVYSTFELGDITKHLMTGRAGNHWGSRENKTYCFPLPANRVPVSPCPDLRILLHCVRQFCFRRRREPVLRLCVSWRIEDSRFFFFCIFYSLQLIVKKTTLLQEYTTLDYKNICNYRKKA